MRHGRWRYFRPRLIRRPLRRHKNIEGSLFKAAHNEIVDILVDHRAIAKKKPHVESLETSIVYWRDRAERSREALDWLVALVLQAPRAAIAQNAMDSHPHGYRHRHDRLFELIDFNDSFDSAVLCFPEDQLLDFNDTVRREMDWLARQVHAPCFLDQQFEAIIHGLSREIAVFKGAKAAGFEVSMTSRRDDAFGIDMVIMEPSGKRRNVDCKTSSSYFLRLQELLREGRITLSEEAQAEKDGFIRVINRGGGREVEVTILRIDSKLLGPITNFQFENPHKFSDLLRRVFID